MKKIITKKLLFPLLLAFSLLVKADSSAALNKTFSDTDPQIVLFNDFGEYDGSENND